MLEVWAQIISLTLSFSFSRKMISKKGSQKKQSFFLQKRIQKIIRPFGKIILHILEIICIIRFEDLNGIWPFDQNPGKHGYHHGMEFEKWRNLGSSNGQQLEKWGWNLARKIWLEPSSKKWLEPSFRHWQVSARSCKTTPKTKQRKNHGALRQRNTTQQQKCRKCVRIHFLDGSSTVTCSVNFQGRLQSDRSATICLEPPFVRL